MKVIEVLASCKQGLTRKQIAEKIKTASGGSLTKVIKELVNCDFVSETGIRTGILPTMITTFGIRHNAYSSIAQASLTMDDLFE